MSITLTTKYLAELKKGDNDPNIVIELALDSGTKRYSYHCKNGTQITRFLADGTYKADGSICAMGDDDLANCNIQATLGSVTSVQNKIDTTKGYTTRGSIDFTIIGRDNFKNLIANNYLKNRRVTRKDGFLRPGFSYGNYATTFEGIVTNWKRSGDTLTITASDDLADATAKIPEENDTQTQTIDYRNTNPVDIMLNIIQTQLGVSTSYINSTAFTNERDTWLNGWAFDRVLTEPKEANNYLNELQQETNSFLVHEGDKITYKVFAPPVPGSTIETWNDNYHIKNGTFNQDSGYKDNFYNRVVVYYDYDESGSDDTDNFESAVIATDTISQASTQWNEVETKTIKSKWIRSRRYTQPTNITGVILFHVSKANSTGTGTLTYNDANNTLTWTAPGGSAGETVTLNDDGKYQIYDLDQTKYVQAVVNTTSLPVSNQTDSITITGLPGQTYAQALSEKLMNRYRDPVATVSFEIDLNNVAWNGTFIKPTDLKDITTDDASEFGDSTWSTERIMITAVRPNYDSKTVEIEGIETRLYKRYGFIAPAGLPDYGAASAAQKEYAFIGTASTNLVGGTDKGYVVW